MTWKVLSCGVSETKLVGSSSLSNIGSAGSTNLICESLFVVDNDWSWVRRRRSLRSSARALTSLMRASMASRFWICLLIFEVLRWKFAAWVCLACFCFHFLFIGLIFVGAGGLGRVRGGM